MSAPAGWYPDPTDPTRELWWTGIAWTADQRPAVAAPRPYVAPAAPSYAAAPVYAPAPVFSAPPKAQVATNTVWVWLSIAASLLPLVVVFFIDWDGYIDAIMLAVDVDDPTGLLAWQLQAFAVSLIGTALLAAFVVFAWLDWRELRRRGVPAPFHWGWSFFVFVSGGIAVYMIGRAVVLGRRTVSGGWAPLWTWIAVTAAAYLVAIVWAVNLFATMMSQLMWIYS